jgi:hypothetical protein
MRLIEHLLGALSQLAQIGHATSPPLLLDT